MLNLSPNRIKSKDGLEGLYIFELLHTPKNARWVAYWIIILMLVSFIALFLPWQQNIQGYGSVTVFDLQDRPQTVYPVVGGRISDWFVQEGQFVQTGDTLAMISEIKDYYFDPRLVERMNDQIRAQKDLILALDQKAQALDEQTSALKQGMVLDLSQARNRVQQLEYRVTMDSADLVAAEIEFKVAQQQYEREKQLFEKTLVSRTDLERLELASQNTTAKLQSAQNKLATSKNQYLNAKINISSIKADYLGKIAKTVSDRNSTLAYIEENKLKRAKLENELSNIEIRQSYYVVRAPQTGYVVKTLKTGIGEIVKEGEGLMTVMPANQQRAVELYVSATDIPLLVEGTKVRLEFDGWPALVFSGWETVTVGTFGGVIQVIDYINTKDKYRVLILPDAEDEKWPKGLRIGSGVYGWAMLNEVPIWYEIWRQLNAFPPLPGKGSPAEDKTIKLDDLY
ncbi:MAG: HlyD family efflux transporter periplasmic adaptor subunit [Bernardetiaceae bacterium]|nr:HlyD family efflux transporter periplasmic adaptor subunit [Bernardetiaceae bacterium]